MILAHDDSATGELLQAILPCIRSPRFAGRWQPLDRPRRTFLVRSGPSPTAPESRYRVVLVSDIREPVAQHLRIPRISKVPRSVVLFGKGHPGPLGPGPTL